MYVLETNILSHTSPSQTVPNADLTAWLARNGDHLYLSVVSVTEVAYGVAWLNHKGSTRRAALLQAWLHDILVFHGDRIVPVDDAIALRAGELMAKARANGVEAGAEDAWIAATADLRGMTALTNNVRHFQPMGVAFLNPFENLPPDGPASKPV